MAAKPAMEISVARPPAFQRSTSATENNADNKFPNETAKDDAYRAIARRHRARYKEFVVLDECDNCEDSVRQREQERQLEAEERWRQLNKGLENAPSIWLPLPGPRIPGGRRPPVPSW